jgi:hypothetical protein
MFGHTGYVFLLKIQNAARNSQAPSGARAEKIFRRDNILAALCVQSKTFVPANPYECRP